MIKDLEFMKCFHCGKGYRIDPSGKKKGLVCAGCGLEIFPLLTRKLSGKNTGQFTVIMGFFTIVAILGGVGGAMLLHGWSMWVTLAIIGGIIYLIGKIFTGKYYLHEIADAAAEETDQEELCVKHTAIFDQLVVDAIKELPEGLHKYLSNVSVVVEDRPAQDVLKKMKIRPDSVLLGLFEGVPLNKRSIWHAGTMPERITLFQKNIEAICRSDEEIKRRIRNVVRHELAHFVGFTEEEIRRLGY
ncbi:MAG: metallopeptidase family protein [Candidatus Loosdrechtia sp.]|uniref:metallopeptidase family protein n=1 Tax=Candidatus Loosdrechtia sp. TaxID=3101272 RepID=UPI003A66676E|nr:MAG: metallopeptidase family protein [Candidatus Jettenia sp. AMX2]